MQRKSSWHESAQQGVGPRNLRAFHEQYWYGEHFLASYVLEHLPSRGFSGLNVLEVGTAEAGLLRFFSELGAKCYGLELSEIRYKNSLLLNPDRFLDLIRGDITNPRTYRDRITAAMDLVILRDVIEHIEEKGRALTAIRDLLGKNGLLFVSFPPKYSAYSGHQQVVNSRFGKLPYIHILPDRVYGAYLKFVGQGESSVNHMLGVKRNRISIARMERLFEQVGFEVRRRDLYFSRPNYRFRYGFPTVKNIFENVPILRELLSNGALYLLAKFVNPPPATSNQQPVTSDQ